jgi:hypothetical protein
VNYRKDFLSRWTGAKLRASVEIHGLTQVRKQLRFAGRRQNHVVWRTILTATIVKTVSSVHVDFVRNGSDGRVPA